MVVAYCDGKPVDRLSPELEAVLAGGSTVELRTEGGRPVGRFVPAETSIPFEEKLTREEVDRRIAEPGGKTLAEIWQKLGVR